MERAVTVTGLTLAVPAKRVSAWMAETDPKYARAWLESLPLADSLESAREIYQALYTLNRQELELERRFELMELYGAPLATVTAVLEGYITRSPLPLTPKKRQLAEFIRQLYMEMAYGYKGCLQDLEKQKLRWGKKAMRAGSLQRSVHYLGEVLLHSYLVYMPYPPGVWRELHAIYRYAVELGLASELVPPAAPASGNTTLEHDYVRALLLGLSNPYQLPQNECRQVQGFLQQWGAKAVLRGNLEVSGPAGGQFLVDLTVDSPPVPFPRDVEFQPGQSLRLLDTSELLQSLKFFIQRLQSGDNARALSLGIDCLEMVCLEILQRMMRAWGQVTRRRYSRIKRSGPVFLCAGISALHFFASGQKPFAPPAPERGADAPDEKLVLPAHIDRDIAEEARHDAAFIALDEPVKERPSKNRPAPAEPIPTSGEAFRVDRWQIKDAAPRGLQLVRRSDARTYVRVGDVVGVQQMDEMGRWSAAVVRWLKSPENNSLEMGVELLASGVKPAAVASARDTAKKYQPAMILPAIEALRRPASLLVPRGAFTPGHDVWLAEENTGTRTVRLLQRLEYTGVFEVFVYADVLTEPARGQQPSNG
jgi:hypothetical protein